MRRRSRPDRARAPHPPRTPEHPGAAPPDAGPEPSPLAVRGVLRVVATPIGNLEDLAPRAVRALRESRIVACEDTRVTRTLLDRHGLKTPLLSCHKFNEAEVATRLLNILAAGGDVALVSDGGTPGLSDPGALVVQAARDAGYAVSPIPGPSALTAIWSVSGWSGPFTMVGFLPHRQGERRRALETWRVAPQPIVVYESPHRILETLADALEILGDRPLCLGRELTKLHEEILHGRLREILTRLADRTPRGEYALVIGPAETPARAAADAMAAAIAAARDGIGAGTPLSEAARRAARVHGVSRRDLYRQLLESRSAIEPGAPDPAEDGEE
jgi:16S rRNA (cytidine1402-2'-O)-methyltransferase